MEWRLGSQYGCASAASEWHLEGQAWTGPSPWLAHCACTEQVGFVGLDARQAAYTSSCERGGTEASAHAHAAAALWMLLLQAALHRRFVHMVLPDLPSALFLDGFGGEQLDVDGRRGVGMRRVDRT